MMDTQQRSYEMFRAALDLATEDRAAFLDTACAGDHVLRAEVESLLSSDAKAEGFLEPPQVSGLSAGEPTETLAAAPTRQLKQIGHYRIKRVIASGGMGTVYEAMQDNPRRTVALKLMKQGITSRSALRRFEYESQILARLRHPGIAQIFEAGTHRDGSGTTPYFAMEYVPNALPITKYATERKLGTRERMALFASVCDAIHHGHQKGIIHRDLKPSNILVDPQGQVKIIDFGVARGTDSDLVVTTLQTDIGQLIGTLQYMSPEQCLADPHDIDTRSDVYALGVVFYELLCDRLPYDVSRKAMHEVTRIIREDQPTKLSTLNKRLRGDIETIALKALEKDREQRYQSATDLRQDIHRYLANEAIAARRPSVLYQLRVLVRRNKPVFAAIAAVFVVLVGASIISTSMYVRSEASRVQAESEAAKANTTLDFLERMYDPPPGGGTPSLKMLLEAAERKIADGALAGQPEVEATVRFTIGRGYKFLRLSNEAAPHLEAALDARRRILGDDHLKTILARSSWAALLNVQGKYGQAESHLREVLRSRTNTLGPEHRSTLTAEAYLVYSLANQGKTAEAEALIRRTLKTLRRVYGPEDHQTLNYMPFLAGVLSDDPSKRDEVEGLLKQVLAIQRRKLGDEHETTLWAMASLGGAMRGWGELVESERIFLEALDISRRRFGDKRITSVLSCDLGLTLMEQGRLEEAERMLRSAVDLSRELLGEENVRTRQMIVPLTKVLVKRGKLDEARPYLTERLRRGHAATEQPDAEANDFNDHARTLLTCELEDLRDPAAALPLAKRAVEMSNGENTQYLDTLALAYFTAGDSAKAIEKQENAVSLLPPGESLRRTDFEANLARYRQAAKNKSPD